MPKTFYRSVRHFHIFQKNGITDFFNILLIVTFSYKQNNARKKIEDHHRGHHDETIGHFGVNFVHVCCHSNELSVTKTIDNPENRDWKRKLEI
jgi:hypothetical protein